MKKETSPITLIILLFAVLFTLVGCTEEGEIKKIDIALTEEQYAFACNKSDIALKNDFNDFLSEIRASGEFDEIVNKYFGGSGKKIGYELATKTPNNNAETFVVVTNCPFEPFEYIGDDGLVYGIDMELAGLYAESRGLELSIMNVASFDSILSEVEYGRADIAMAGLTVTDKRKETVNFTSTYYSASQVLLVREDSVLFDGCKTADDVNAVLSAREGLSVGYQRGTTGEFYINGDESFGFSGFANIEGKHHDTSVEAIMNLKNGNIDAVIIDEGPSNALLRSTGGFGDKINIFIETMKNEKYRRDLFEGLLNTVKVAVIALIIGILVGTLIAMVKVAPKYSRVLRLADKLCSFYVTLFRGTPMVVQLLLSYYVFLPLIGVRGVDALAVGIVVFGLNSGAYVSEIMRGGIASVDKGQMEGGRALGLGYNITMLKIVIPQAVKNILPTLGNEFITLIKETSVLSFITVTDLYTALSLVGSKNYEKMIPYIVMALIYILLVLIIGLFVKWIERILAKSDKTTVKSKSKVTA